LLILYDKLIIKTGTSLKLVIVAAADLTSAEIIIAQEAAISNLIMYEVYDILFD